MERDGRSKGGMEEDGRRWKEIADVRADMSVVLGYLFLTALVLRLCGPEERHRIRQRSAEGGAHSSLLRDLCAGNG